MNIDITVKYKYIKGGGMLVRVFEGDEQQANFSFEKNINNVDSWTLNAIGVEVAGLIREHYLKDIDLEKEKLNNNLLGEPE